MAWAEKASMRATGSLSGDSGTLAFPNNVAAGDLLICAGAAWQSSGAPTGVTVTSTQTTGNWSTLLGTIFDTTQRSFIAYAVATGSGSCTVTINPAGSAADSTFSIDAFTGQHATPLDVDGGTSTGIAGNSAGTASDALTPTVANDLLIGVMTHSTGGRTLTAGADYTTIGENENNESTQCHHAVFRFVTTAQSYTVSVDYGTGAGDYGTWGLQTAAFKESTDGAVGIPSLVMAPYLRR